MSARARIAQRVVDRVRNRLALRERHRIDEDHSRAARTGSHGSRDYIRRVARILRLHRVGQAGFARGLRRLLRAARESHGKASHECEHPAAKRAGFQKYLEY